MLINILLIQPTCSDQKCIFTGQMQHTFKYFLLKQAHQISGSAQDISILIAHY